MPREERSRASEAGFASDLTENLTDGVEGNISLVQMCESSRYNCHNVTSMAQHDRLIRAIPWHCPYGNVRLYRKGP